MRRARWLAALLWLSPGRAAEPGPPGRCDLVANACVHSGDPTTQCYEWTGMVVDPARRCLLQPHKVFHCELIRGSPGFGCGDAFRCMRDGSAYAFVSSTCIYAERPESCEPALAEAIIEDWEEPGGLPDCATLRAHSISPP